MTLPLIQVTQIVPVIVHKFLSKTLQALQTQPQLLPSKRTARIHQTQLINSLQLTSLQLMLHRYHHRLVQ